MLEQNNTGLILVDMQGKLARIVHDSDQIISNIEKIIKGCQILSIPIIWLEQYPKGLGETIPELKKILNGIKPIIKSTFNAFENENFKKSVIESKKNKWLICGIEAHICVYQTTLGLLSNNFEVEVLADCISSRSKNSTKLALEKLQQKGASLTNVEMCLFELVKDSKSERFKEILELLR